MSDRIVGLLVAVLALAFFASATQLEQPFFADPLGPKAFPMVVATVGFFSGCFMVFRPDPDPIWPGPLTLAHLALTVLILIGYALTLIPLGFLLPTALASASLSYQIKSQVKFACLTGLGLSVGLFVIFKFGLGLSLFAVPSWLTG